MTEVLCVTLARGGSKGVPDKHTRLLNGKPVLEYTLDAVLQSNYGRHYVVSSDSEKILRIAQMVGVDTIKRPPGLAKDDTPTMPALKHAVSVYEANCGLKFEYIAEVRATSPLKNYEDINAMVELLIDSGADSVIGVTPLEDHHPARAKWIDDYGQIHDFFHEPSSGRRQDLEPKAYVRNGSVYALSRKSLDNGILFGHERSLAYVMPAERSVNIDTELDFVVAKVLLERD